MSRIARSCEIYEFLHFFVMLINPQPESRGLRISQNLPQLRKIASWTILRQCVAKFMNFCTFLWCYKLTHNPRDAACGVFQTCENREKIASLQNNTRQQQELRRNSPRKLTHNKKQGLWHGCLLNCLLIATIDTLCSRASEGRLSYYQVIPKAIQYVIL